MRIPMERLKPDQVFAVPGAPDWMAIDEDVWVSNEPEELRDANRSACERRVGPIKCRQGALLRVWPLASAACGCPSAASRRCRVSI